MQAVISRVHRIVTTHAAGGESDPNGSTPSPSAASMALSSLGGAPASSASTFESASASPAHSRASHGNNNNNNPAHPVESALRPRPAAASPVRRDGSSGNSTARLSATNGGAAEETGESVAVGVKQEIQLAVERLQYATLLGERKKATKMLHELARSYIAADESQGDYDGARTKPRPTAAHRVLGETAIPIVLNALISDPRDTELMEAMLEFLQEIVAKSPTTATSLLQPMNSNARGGHSSFSMQGAPTSGIQICLQLLQDPSPWIRGPTITLVKLIQEAKQKDFAAAVLECKEGLRRLLEVVEDKREHIRDAALQVLVKLTEREKMVQQFLAFEDGFVRLFQIMEIEGLVEGSSVISDCLQIVNNMVRDNLMTQTLLREMPYLESHLPQLLRLPHRDASSDEDGSVTSTKSYQKKRALKLGLQLVRFLVAGLHEGVPDSKLDELAVREKARKDAELGPIQSFIGRQTDLMGAIGEIACCQNEDLTDLQLQALDLLELLGSSNGGNQVILVNLQSKPSHMSVLSEFVRLDCSDEETPVSAAATSLLDSLFRNNETTKMAIFQQLNAPPPMDDGNDVPPTVPAGRVLLDALIGNAEAIVQGGEKRDSLRLKTIASWKACHRLTSLLAGSDLCKELALRIPSEYENPDVQAVAGGLFLTRCLRLFSSSTVPASKTQDLPAAIFQIKVGVLCLLIQWCIDCSNAVREIVGSVANLSILVEHFVKEEPLSSRSASEAAHVRGLIAMLLGCCLEYLVDARQQELPPLRGTPTEPLPDRSPGAQMTREQLLEMISKRIGLERFTDAFIRFQQAPLVVACARGSRNQTSRNVLPQRAVFEDESGADPSSGHGTYLFSLYEKPFIAVYREMSDKIQKRIISIYTCAESGTQDGASSNAMGAYQDLIRIQDRHLQDLEKQLADLRNAHVQQGDAQAIAEIHSATSGGDIHEAIEKTRKEMDAAFAEQLENVKRQHAREKGELEGRVKTMEAAAVERETRFNGLSIAFEQLEVDHQKQGEKLKSALAAASGSVSSASAMLPGEGQRDREELEAVMEKCSILEYELNEEKQMRMQAEKHFSLDKNELEMHHLRLQKDIEDLRMHLGQRDEQIQETNQMLEALEAGQSILKKENEKLKAQLRNGDHTVGHDSDGDLSMQSQTESLQKENDSLRKELVSKQAELDLARETHREFERRCVSQLEGGSAKEIFNLLEKQRAKTRELKELLAHVTSEKTVLEQQIAAHQDERAASQARLDEVEVPLNEDAARSSSAVEEDIPRLKALIEKQLTELQELRSLVDKMEALSLTSAKELEAKEEALERLEQTVASLKATSSEQATKVKAKLAALENELAQSFLEKEGLQRKSVNAVKDLENEVARLFLEKIELEKLVREKQHGDVGRSSGADAAKQTASMAGLHIPPATMKAAESASPVGMEASIDCTLEDAYMLLASLEIHCGVLRESLREAKGEEAVLAAASLSRQRGALTI